MRLPKRALRCRRRKNGCLAGIRSWGGEGAKSSLSVLGFCCVGAASAGLPERQTSVIFGFFGLIFSAFFRGKTEVHCDGVFFAQSFETGSQQGHSFSPQHRNDEFKKGARKSKTGAKKSCIGQEIWRAATKPICASGHEAAWRRGIGCCGWLILEQ